MKEINKSYAIKAFSLIEITIAMLVVAILMAAATPIITKRAKVQPSSSTSSSSALWETDTNENDIVNTNSGNVNINGEVYVGSGKWLRTQGVSGWYNQMYQSGWYMSDASWIRTYGGKSVWTAGGLLGSDGGLTVGYGSAAPPAGGAAIKGNTGINGFINSYRTSYSCNCHPKTGSCQTCYTNYGQPNLSVVGAIAATGTIIASAPNAATSGPPSDRRLKRDIKYIDNNYYNNLLKLNSVSFNWKRELANKFATQAKVGNKTVYLTELGQGNDLYSTLKDNHKQYGFIAQDVEKVFPNIVYTDKHGYKSIKYQEFIPLLIEAIKSHDKMFKGIISNVAKLQKTVNSLVIGVKQVDNKIIALIKTNQITDQRIKNLEAKNKQLELDNKQFKIRFAKLEKEIKR